MTIQGLTNKIFQNKTVLKNLARISDHGTSFSAGTSLVLSSTIRPLSIFSTPDTEKENKQYAAANSICSGIIKFGIVESIALPIENAVKNIDKNPEKFLNPQTIKNLKTTGEELAKSQSYNLLTQLFKLGVGFFTAIPKSMLTLALIPILMDKLFFKKKSVQNPTEQVQNMDKFLPKNNKNLNFTGLIQDTISTGLGHIINLKFLQNFAKKYQDKDKDIAKHITAVTDILLTTSFAIQTNKSKKIKENRKKALIYNNVISTAITLSMGYGIDNYIKKKSEKFIERFKQLNANDPKLSKYVEGIHILRPALIFAGIYYGILPLFSTFMAEKIDKFVEKHSK